VARVAKEDTTAVDSAVSTAVVATTVEREEKEDIMDHTHSKNVKLSVMITIKDTNMDMVSVSVVAAVLTDTV